ncbi:MAG: recombinase family protein [Aeriscardovia sp.]|nr:recombinase family protein [Aeriscardovia sp.]
MINYLIIRGGNRAIIWTRVSTKYQEDNGGSLKSQKETCERYAAERGYEVVRYFGGAHESAKTPGKMIQEMTAFVKRDKSISTVLISEFDRFSRELWQATKMLEDMRRLGIIVIATKFGLDTRTKEGMLMAQQTLSMAQWDNQNRTDKFVGGRIDCMKAGAYIEKAPLGYYKVGKSRDTFCYLNDTGILLSKAFQWKLKGDTNKEILMKLEAHGLKITKQTLHKVLVNPFYAGKIRHKFTNMELIDGRIEPAVTYMDFLRVQDILSGRTGTYVHQKEKPTFPLTHFVFCSDDGKPLSSYVVTKKLKTRELEFGYYKCYRQGCNTNVSAKEMHEKYEDLLFKYDVDEKTLAAFETVIRRMFNSYSSESEKESASLKRQISEIKNTIREVKLRFASGKIDDDTFSVAIQEYTNRRDVLLLELEKWQMNISNQNEIIPVIIATASKIGTLWKNADLERKKKIQKLVFPEGIFWDKKKRAFLTKNRNAVFDILDRISATYGDEKGPPLSEAVPSCG